MFCKKCGTEQREGQRFCPKCGEPFLDVNGKPYLKGIAKKGLITKILVGVLVLCLFLVVVTRVCTTTDGVNSGFYQGKTPQEEFLESLDKSSTAYAARIDLIVRPGAYGIVVRKEVQEGAGDKENSYKWTLIFFPDNETKTTGRATLEAWFVDRKALADALTRTYKYEIRDGRIELYNGYKKPSFSHGWTKVDDIRLYIEKGSEGVQLKGEFQNEQRVFKQTDYLESKHRDQHRYVH